MEQIADAGASMTPAVENKQKNGKGLKIATAIACIVAICGIGFGVYGMIRSAQKDSQISDLKVQIKEDDGTITTIETPEIETATNNGTTITITDPTMSNENPVIKLQNGSEAYSVSFESSLITSENRSDIISIDVKDGKIAKCEIGRRMYEVTNGRTSYSTRKISDCTVDGLNGDISNIVEFGSLQDTNYYRIGFLMTDGTVEYTLPIFDIAESGDSSVKGTLDINGHVNNAIRIRVADTERGYGGYMSTVFMLSDGDYVKFDESMLK